MLSLDLQAKKQFVVVRLLLFNLQYFMVRGPALSSGCK